MIKLPSELDEVLKQGGTVLVPSRQRAHAARFAYGAAELSLERRVWATPDILTVEAWLTREVERYARKAGIRMPRLLSPAEDWFLWRQCASEATRELELVNRGALAEALRRASAMAADFGIDIQHFAKSLGAEELAQAAGEPGIETALLVEVQRAVEERCRSVGATSVGALVSQLPVAEGGQAVVGSGFLTLPPRLRGLVVPARETSSQAVPKVVVATDEVDELERIAHWCTSQLAGRPDVRLLVTLPGAPGARERLATLIRQAINPSTWLGDASRESTMEDSMDGLVVIEGGAPLSSLPAIGHALTTLSWLAGSPSDFEALSGWLRDPYWRAPGAAARARLDLWLRERERMQFKVRDFLNALSAAPSALTSTTREISGQISRSLIALGQGAASPRDWAERFRATLDVLGWPGERARTSGEQQTIVRFHELLDEFGQLAAVTRTVSRDNAIQWFTELATRTAFRPADNDAVITIASGFAAPVVHYDGLWIAGLHAEAFPEPVQPDPFLPLASQLAAGVPAASAAGRLAEARALLASWRSCASELVLSAPARSEDLELLPSPLLAQWLPRAASADELRGVEPTTSSLWLPSRAHREGLLETFDDPVGIHWPKDRPLPSGTRSLELQNQCPFRAYAELRLGSRPLDAPEPGVAADQRGQLLHLALQKLWQRLRDSRGLESLSGHVLEATIHRCVEEAAGEILRGAPSQRTRPATTSDAQGDLFGNPQYSPSLSRECRRAERLIGALCVLERERAPFRVDNTEFESTFGLGGAQLRVRIDRVDALESGGRAILDYKSGRRTPADWYGERPSHPQLLAYLAALGDGVVAMATVNVTAREVRFDGIASSSDLLPKVKGVEAPFGTDAWPLRRQEWLARVEQLAIAFLGGKAEVDPKPGACDYCHVSSICRIADRAPPSENDASI